MRRVILAVCAALCVGLLGACGDGDESQESNTAAKPAKTAVYFGWLLGTREPAAVAIEVDRADTKGMSRVRAYVCDGRGEPAGMAVWFGGPINAAATTKPGANAKLTSAGGNETLVLDHVAAGRIQGSFKDEKGARRQFVAYPAIDGAGIYEVSLSQGLRYKGISTDGNRLAATAQKSGRTTGTITTAAGKKVKFAVQSLALATPARLAARGLPTDYGRYKEVNQVPGEYVAVIAPGGSHWLGRSGNVRGGQSGLNIIGLDKKC
ncbi:MAG: hypothetical protein QOI64_1878 [Solirubrobacteraceae bacterium]|jgi:hypothetical protein|nr:hypothetical protein [Solirubrobacteraceae bacterium]